jgi:hypothetical protein
MCFSHFYALSYKSLLNTTHHISISNVFSFLDSSLKSNVSQKLIKKIDKKICEIDKNILLNTFILFAISCMSSLSVITIGYNIDNANR